MFESSLGTPIATGDARGFCLWPFHVCHSDMGGSQAHDWWNLELFGGYTSPWLGLFCDEFPGDVATARSLLGFKLL